MEVIIIQVLGINRNFQPKSPLPLIYVPYPWDLLVITFDQFIFLPTHKLRNWCGLKFDSHLTYIVKDWITLKPLNHGLGEYDMAD